MNTFVFGLCILFGIAFLIVYAIHDILVIAPHDKARLKGEAHQRQQAVVERRTETVTEKVVIELVPNEDLSQSLTNLIGSIENNTDATNHHAKVIETTAQRLPLLQEVPLENADESQVSQERAIPPMALSQSESQASSKSDTKTRQEIIAELLLEYPNISGREIERRTGIPDATARRILKELKGG